MSLLLRPPSPHTRNTRKPLLTALTSSSALLSAVLGASSFVPNTYPYCDFITHLSS